MRIAVVGSRNYRKLNRVETYILLSLHENDVVVSGWAIGVDRTAVRAARKYGLDVVEYLPDYEKYGNVAPLIRNSSIVEDCDKVVAFWNGESRGTLDSIIKAVKLGKLVEIIPDV
jgi:hypothetical protein